MAEIAAAFPTAGGIYFWSYRLGGDRYGRFLSWMTAWWNWAGWICVVPGVQQGATNFLLSALEIRYPDSTVIYTGWFSWLLTALGMVLAMLPNVLSQRVLQLYFRFAVFIFFVLFAFYWIWFPIKASGKFQSGAIFDKFYNGINYGEEKQASDSYAWIVGILFGCWEFYGSVYGGKFFFFFGSSTWKGESVVLIIVHRPDMIPRRIWRKKPTMPRIPWPRACGPQRSAPGSSPFLYVSLSFYILPKRSFHHTQSKRGAPKISKTDLTA